METSALYTFVPSSLVYVNIHINCESYVQKINKIIEKYQGREGATSNFVTTIVSSQSILPQHRMLQTGDQNRRVKVFFIRVHMKLYMMCSYPSASGTKSANLQLRKGHLKTDVHRNVWA